MKGERERLKQFFNELCSHMSAKLEGILGPDRSAGDVQDVTCLNRIFTWKTDEFGHAITMEADPRHVQIILSQLQLG